MQTTTRPTELLRAFLAFLDDLQSGPVAGFRASIDADLAERPLEARTLDCLRHLDRVADIVPPAARPLVGILADNRDTFRWAQTYTPADFGAGFTDNYGWVEVFGTRGHFASDTVAGGFLLLGPDITYPDHHHLAEEIYVPLTGGTLWRKGDGPYVTRDAGTVIHHSSNVNHAMRTGSEALLALYLWRGGPLAQRPVVTASSTGA